MAKYCPKCGNENKDSSKFCESCGEQLPESATVSAASDIPPSSKPKGGWWSQQSTGVKAGIALGGLCCLGIIAVIVIFGLFTPDLSTLNTTSSNTTPASTTALTQTFSKSGITFNYPSDWESTDAKYATSGDSQELGALRGSSDFGVIVNKQDMTATVKEAYENTKNSLKTATEISPQLLSESQITVNGITAYEMIYTYKGDNSKEFKSMYVIIGKDGQVVYYLQFIDSLSSFDSNKKVMDDIVNTIKIQ